MTREEFIQATDNGRRAILCVHIRSGKLYEVNGGTRENYEATIEEPGPYVAIGEAVNPHPRLPNRLRCVNLANLRLADISANI